MDVVTGDCCEGWGVSGRLWPVSVVKGGCSDEVKCDFVIGEGCDVSMVRCGHRLVRVHVTIL